MVILFLKKFHFVEITKNCQNFQEKWAEGFDFRELCNPKAIVTAQKMMFFYKDFFRKCNQIRNFPRIWSHLLKKTIIKNFILRALNVLSYCWNLRPANYLASHCNIKIKSRKKYGIYSELTIKTPEQCRWGRCGIFIVIFEHILHLFLVFLWLTLNIFFVSSISHILHLW